MKKNTSIRMRGMSVVNGYAMSCAPAFLSGKAVKVGRVSIEPATVLFLHGKSVPIAIGGPPTHNE